MLFLNVYRHDKTFLTFKFWAKLLWYWFWLSKHKHRYFFFLSISLNLGIASMVKKKYHAIVLNIVLIADKSNPYQTKYIDFRLVSFLFGSCLFDLKLSVELNSLIVIIKKKSSSEHFCTKHYIYVYRNWYSDIFIYFFSSNNCTI